MNETPRPFRLGDLLGHERAKSLLAAAVAADAYPNAWLFAGPMGVGKYTAALAVAAAANCRAGDDGGGGLFGGAPAKPEPRTDACGTCASCRKIAAANHPDVRTIRVPADKRVIPIESVREAIGELSYRPYEGRRRFVIVDGAESLTPQASNALLKTLEEPPAHSTWILVSTSPARLLPTIVSRCRIVRFGALDVETAAGLLAREGKMERGEARAIAGLLGGSVGRALGPDAEHFSQETRAQVIDEALDAIGAGGGKILDIAEAWDKRAKDETLPLPTALEQLSLFIRDVAALQAASLDARAAILMHSDLADRTDRAARRAPSDGATRAFDSVRRCVNDLKGNVNSRLALETMFLALRRELVPQAPR
ncbi:MAG TPA: DNA polymerase III subunit delta' [bacterium]|nr:DNA polymerase III subunit delta' [bacterium]